VIEVDAEMWRGGSVTPSQFFQSCFCLSSVKHRRVRVCGTTDYTKLQLTATRFFVEMNVPDRLKALRLHNQWTWDQLAKELDLSVSMIYQVNRGGQNLSDKALYRLEQLEQKHAASMEAANWAISNPSELAKLLAEEMRDAEIKISDAQIDAGEITVPLEYRSGRTPKGCPRKITLRRPDNRTTQKLLADINETRNPDPILLACLPEEFRSDKFLNRLTPFCFHGLDKAAFVITFGREGEKHYNHCAATDRRRKV
jgi:transcriptional regulator with XRE-family HTH domain